MRVGYCILGVLALLMLAPLVCAVEVELTDTEYIIVNTSMDSPNSSVLDASDSPVQENPSNQIYIVDTEYSVADTDFLMPGSSVLDASGSPVQDNPSNQIYIIDTEYKIMDNSGLKPWNGSDVPVIMPVASFVYSTTGLVVSFNSTSYDPKGDSLLSYYWDFGDGETSGVQNTSHTYRASASYPVTLVVTDFQGYKASKTEIVSVHGAVVSRVIHPSDIPIGADLTVEVYANIESDIEVSFSAFHDVKRGTDVVFNIDTSALPKGEHMLRVIAGPDIYMNPVIIYEPVVYQSIAKELDDLGVCSKNEMHEISGKTGKALTNHVYTLLLSGGVNVNIASSDVLNELCGEIGYVRDKVTVELDMFKSILVSIDQAIAESASEMDDVIHPITNVQNAINVYNEQTSDDDIVGTVNEYVTEPAVYNAMCIDEAITVDVRTLNAKLDFVTFHPEDRVERIKDVLLIGKEAIANTDGEQIYKLYIGTVLGREISVKPTLDHLAKRQIESLNPPDDMCIDKTCVLGKYNPIWVFRMCLGDAESILTVPAWLGWIPVTPEDESMQPTVGVMAVPAVIAIKKAIKIYMKYTDKIGEISPWVIDGGMIISTDLLAKEVDEEHEAVIQAVYDVAQSVGVSGVGAPVLTGSSLYVPEGNMLVRTSPDGRIRDFKYVKSDTLFSKPKAGTLVSLNAGWSQSFDTEEGQVWVSISSNASSYDLGDVVNLTVCLSSDTFLDDAMLWIFVPEANMTIKDIVNVSSEDMCWSYNFTVLDEVWHVPRVYLADFGAILAENYTSFGVGAQFRDAGIVTLDYDVFYSPGTVALNVTVHNAGNVSFEPVLEYSGTVPGLAGSIDVPVLDVGEHITEQLVFELMAPEVYELHFVLNSSSGMLDYNVARFTVTAIDTLLAFPSSDKPIYDAGDSVNITVTVKNITLDVVDFPYLLETITPSGDVTDLTSFVPVHNGTYIVKAEPIAEGYCVIEGETLFIVERQSSLFVETETVDNATVITVRTDAGGVVEGAHVVVNGYVLKTDEEGVVEFISANATQLVISAEKFGFNPAVILVNLGLQTFNISLEKGWNLISLPLQPENTSLFSVFPPDELDYTAVWAYYGDSWKRYDFLGHPGLNDLETIEAGRGYWINMSTAGTLAIWGTVAEGSIHLGNGWNLVGYNSLVSRGVVDAMSSVDGNYSAVWQYKDNCWYRHDLKGHPGLNDLDVITSGYGYWINVNTTGCDWVV